MQCAQYRRSGSAREPAGDAAERGIRSGDEPATRTRECVRGLARAPLDPASRHPLLPVWRIGPDRRAVLASGARRAHRCLGDRAGHRPHDLHGRPFPRRPIRAWSPGPAAPPPPLRSHRDPPVGLHLRVGPPDPAGRRRLRGDPAVPGPRDRLVAAGPPRDVGLRAPGPDLDDGGHDSPVDRSHDGTMGGHRFRDGLALRSQHPRRCGGSAGGRLLSHRMVRGHEIPRGGLLPQPRGRRPRRARGLGRAQRPNAPTPRTRRGSSPLPLGGSCAWHSSRAP